MSRLKSVKLPRRQILKGAAVTAGAAFAAPTIIPSSALGLDGATAPSERVVVGGIGIGRRGTYDLGCFLEQSDVQFAAVCDIKESARLNVKKIVDQKYAQSELLNVSRLSGSPRSKRHRCRFDRDRPELALPWRGPCGSRRQRHLLRETVYEEYRAEHRPRRYHEATARIFQAETQRRNLPHYAFACWLARSGKLGKLTKVYAHPRGMQAMSSGWLPAQPEPDKGQVDWDMYLGPAAWRPFNEKHLDGFNFEKGGGLVGGGVLEWGSHCVDLCQWAVGDCPPPIQYDAPQNDELVATYEDGCQLIFREKGWIPLGSCPVRFEGEKGWVEAGDSGKMF